MILKDTDQDIKQLLSENEELKNKLYEANSIIEAIKEGAVDALVVTKEGKPHVYSIESADYTYRILIEKFGEGALSISEEGLILYCNDYFSKLIDIPANKIVGTFFNSYVQSTREFTLLKASLINGPSKGEIILNANGRKLPVYVSLTDLHPNVHAIGVVVTDLTEKRKHEEALFQYQQKLELKVNELNLTNTNLEQFIHVISHDLKEPMRKIISYTSHLSDSKSELFTESELNNLRVIKSSVLRLNSLVDDLVKYAFTATKAEDSEIDLNEVVSEVRDDIELLIKENDVEIVLDTLPKISGSKVQMRQLFSNLISNAIKYSKKDVRPRIIITSEIVTANINLQDKQFYKIAIEDNGIGMEKMHLEKIFTMFLRLHMRNEYSGNGIGLAICKKIMENHNGKIEVESSTEGSIFKLFFPVTDH